MEHRLHYHFTPEKGWMNDPNGTIYINGQYHLFYQYYPHDIVWGPMHWGHAISEDLLHWEYKPIALYPDDLGYIFSGSCVYDSENVSGLGRDGKKPLVAIYTNHNPATGEQQQSIAYSFDFIHFEPYAGNPVIKNQKEMENYQVDFRDPKVFINPIKGGYSMVLAAGRHLEFYHSQNLLNWKKTGEFDPSRHGFSGICECPDCFYLEVGDEKKWVLTLSSILENEKVGLSLAEQGYQQPRVMQYFVGDFDGNRFVDTENSGSPLLLDYGPDNYAMVTFFGTKEPVMIGWGEHWDYAAKVPAEKYRGKMTLPRKVSLCQTEVGYRLQSNPYIDLQCQLKDFQPKDIMKEYQVPEGDSITFSSTTGSCLTIEVTSTDIVVKREVSKAGEWFTEFKTTAYNEFTAPRYTKGKCSVIVIRDENYFEIYTEDAKNVFSIMLY